VLRSTKQLHLLSDSLDIGNLNETNWSQVSDYCCTVETILPNMRITKVKAEAAGHSRATFQRQPLHRPMVEPRDGNHLESPPPTCKSQFSTQIFLHRTWFIVIHLNYLKFLVIIMRRSRNRSALDPLNITVNHRHRSLSPYVCQYCLCRPLQTRRDSHQPLGPTNTYSLISNCAK
jgi:hypothetical protein